MNRAPALFTILIISLVIAGHAFADGVIIPDTANAKVNIPDQEALIHWADGVETLIIQTSFTGEGDAFAWVVPTPSKPEITASTTGLFPTLRTLTAPNLWHPQYQLYVGVWFVMLIIMGYALDRGRETLVAAVVLFLLYGLFMPALSTSSHNVVLASVRVHERTVVGEFDVVVLSVDDPPALTRWLDDNGFKTPAQTGEAMRAYVDDGWYFTAVRLSRERSEHDLSNTHPLAFRFPVDQPVYPLRLTATGSSALNVDLYVFGPKRAAADGFEAQYCNRLAYPADADENDWPKGWFGDETPIRQPELRSRVQPAAFVTKLSASLSPAQMSRDAQVLWDGENTFTPARWTYPGARNVAINVGWSCLALAALGALVVFRKAERMRQVGGKAVLFLIGGVAASVLVACAVYMILPKVEANIVSVSRIRWHRMEDDLQQVIDSMKDRTDMKRFVDEAHTGPWSVNPFTGDAMIVEDSPGNFTCEWTDEGMVITAYGPDGLPLRIDGNDPDRD